MTEELESKLLLEAYAVIVGLKNHLLDRLTNEGLPSTASEDEYIRRATTVCLSIKEEIIDGPKATGT